VRSEKDAKVSIYNLRRAYSTGKCRKPSRFYIPHSNTMAEINFVIPEGEVEVD
jgi:hypothetical protein